MLRRSAPLAAVSVATFGTGTGQGLAVARSLVKEKHGGTLTFETEVGQGTTFYVRLPIGGKTDATNAQ